MSQDNHRTAQLQDGCSGQGTVGLSAPTPAPAGPPRAVSLHREAFQFLPHLYRFLLDSFQHVQVSYLGGPEEIMYLPLPFPFLSSFTQAILLQWSTTTDKLRVKRGLSLFSDKNHKAPSDKQLVRLQRTPQLLEYSLYRTRYFKQIILTMPTIVLEHRK